MAEAVLAGTKPREVNGHTRKMSHLALLGPDIGVEGGSQSLKALDGVLFAWQLVPGLWCNDVARTGSHDQYIEVRLVNVRDVSPESRPS
jgi:hypothetical protein